MRAAETLGELAGNVPGAKLTGDPATPVGAVVYDSRRASQGSLFVAIRGLAADGNRFIEAARRKGAVAVASEEPPHPGIPWLRVPDARVALALLSAANLGNPAASCDLVGVTGTNGKTTTTVLIHEVLRAVGDTPGLVGTLHYKVGDQVVDSARTTPESSDLQGLFRKMVDAGCRRVVMEVSSHALALERVAGCTFRVAVFTNLTRDHLDFHGTMDGYFAAKRRLFAERLAADGTAILNADDDRVEDLRAASGGRVWTYSIDGPADLRVRNLRLDLDGARYSVDTPEGEVVIESRLLGRFNVSNTLAALGAVLALGVPKAIAARVLGELPGVPGRLERIDMGQPFAVVVDYAHTDDGMKQLLETVRNLRPRRILTVLGCGGDRDRTKRPLMGMVAARLSDQVFVTSDNPRSEPPEVIAEEILRGISTAQRSHVRTILDRRDAIEAALAMAGPGDAVVIAGKGHETTQTIRDRVTPFDDRVVAREILRGLDGRRRS